MDYKLTAAEKRTLAAINDNLVSYSPGARGGHLWQRHDRETRDYKTVTGSRMTALVGLGFVEPPKPRASGAAKLTDAGRVALANEES